MLSLLLLLLDAELCLRVGASNSNNNNNRRTKSRSMCIGRCACASNLIYNLHISSGKTNWLCCCCCCCNTTARLLFVAPPLTWRRDAAAPSLANRYFKLTFFVQPIGSSAPLKRGPSKGGHNRLPLLLFDSRLRVWTRFTYRLADAHHRAGINHLKRLIFPKHPILGKR